MKNNNNATLMDEWLDGEKSKPHRMARTGT